MNAIGKVQGNQIVERVDGKPTFFAGTCLALFCGLVLGMLVISAFAADEPSYTPPAFACELRYYFREQGEESVSAVSYEREALPLSRVAVSDGSVSRIVEGSVAHLPYRFLIKITLNSDTDKGTLEVNVCDDSGKPLEGFPQVMANPLTRTGDSSRKDFELPVTAALKKAAEKTLLENDQSITYVALVIGMDADFLSSAFPKCYGSGEINSAQNLYIIERDDFCGFSDKLGKPVSPPRYGAVKPFSKGLARVYEAGSWGFIDSEGKMQIKPDFWDADDFSDGTRRTSS